MRISYLEKKKKSNVDSGIELGTLGVIALGVRHLAKMYILKCMHGIVIGIICSLVDNIHTFDKPKGTPSIILPPKTTSYTQCELLHPCILHPWCICTPHF